MAGFLEQEPASHGTTPVRDDLKIEMEDIDTVRKELRTLRRGRELLALRGRKAKRELARTRRRQKEARNAYQESHERVLALSKELGCPTDLPEIDEWRELAREHSAKEKELQAQLEYEKEEHRKCIEALQRQVDREGCPESLQEGAAKKNEQKCRSAEMNCMRIQAIRDFVDGVQEDFSVEELRGVLQDADRPDDELDVADDHSGLVAQVHRELAARHEESMREVVKLANVVIRRKNRILDTLGLDVISRGFEDMRLCTPQEKEVLKEILVDAENVVFRRASRQAGKTEHSLARVER